MKMTEPGQPGAVLMVGVTTEQVLQAAVDAARAAVLTRFTVASCIATTRVTIEVLRYFGVTARPWAVNAKIFNDAAWGLAQAGVPIGDWPDGAWSVGIDVAAGPERVGHLVALTDRWLVDGSLDQAARPGKGIPVIKPLVGPLPDRFDPDGPDAALMYREHASGVYVTYQPAGSRAYTTSPQWRRNQPLIRACTGEAIRALRAAQTGGGT